MQLHANYQDTRTKNSARSTMGISWSDIFKIEFMSKQGNFFFIQFFLATVLWTPSSNFLQRFRFLCCCVFTVTKINRKNCLDKIYPIYCKLHLEKFSHVPWLTSEVFDLRSLKNLKTWRVHFRTYVIGHDGAFLNRGYTKMGIFVGFV